MKLENFIVVGGFAGTTLFGLGRHWDLRSFAETRYAPLAGFIPTDLHYGAGFVMVSGTTGLGTRSVYAYPRDSPTPNDLTPYFAAAYPSGNFIAIDSMAPYTSNQQAYLIAALHGVGDLFTISQAASAIPAASTATLMALAAAIAAIALLRLRG